MAARRSRSLMLLVQAVLLALCVTTSLVLAGWVFGYNGSGLVSDSDLPGQLRAGESNAQPSEPVLVHGEEGVATVAAANEVIGVLSGRTTQTGDGSSEFYGNGAFLSFLALTGTQHAAWVAVRALPALGLAVIWWLLFRVVQGVRGRGGFTRSVARRMWAIGVLVAVGLPLVQVLRWEVARWLVESSSAARIANVPALDLDLWPFAVGLVILVMASTWREAASMRDDLAGLV